jgi:hypothetical protein
MSERTIGELAQAAGVNVETVRYYERRGLVAQPPRTPSGYRKYASDDVVAAARKKLEDVSARMAHLATLQCRLRQLVEACETGDSIGCVSLEVSESVSGA